MSNQHDLSDEDLKLLGEIEQLINHEERNVQETDSLYGFCAHLSSTIPRGEGDFKKSLENRLQEEIQRLQQEQMTEKQIQGNDNEHNFTNSTLMKTRQQGRIKRKILHILQHYVGGIIMPQTGKQKLGFVIIIMLVFIVNLSISIPSLRAQIKDAVQKIFLGDHTGVQQVDPESNEFKSRLSKALKHPKSPDDKWFLRTEICNYSSNLYTTTDLDEAQAASNFRIKIPETLPEGYSLREVKLVVGMAFLFYDGAGDDIIIVQQVVDNRFIPDTSPRKENVSHFSGYFTNSPVKEGEFKGRLKTAWMDNKLVWEEDGISFTIGGLDLSEDEALSIAASLK